MALEIALATLAFATAPPAERREVVGRSARGRRIHAVALGDARGARNVLVVGCVHGNECAGVAITRRLARGRPRAGVGLWLVHQLNPDGFRLGVRQNGRGVDLNRNFGSGWRRVGHAWDPTHSGPRPFSEPESRAVRRLVLRLRPRLVIWFHQPQALVRTCVRRTAPVARRYARLAGLPFRRLPCPPGAATLWQSRRLPGTHAFVVELPPGPLSPAAAARHARAVRLLAAD